MSENIDYQLYEKHLLLTLSVVFIIPHVIRA